MTIAELSYQPKSYIAFVLDEETREKLMKICPPTFRKTICHHVTIAYRPDEDTFVEFQKAYEKKDPVVRATGILIGDTIEAFTIEVDGHGKRKYSTSGGFYHVTLSLDLPAKPVDANKLFHDHDAKKIPFHKPITLTGEFKLVQG